MNDLKLEKEVYNKKTFLLGIIAILLLMASVIISSTCEYYFPNYKTIVGIVYYVFNILFLFFLFRSRLKRDFEFLKDNFKKYLKFIIKNQIIMFVIYLFISFIVTILLRDPTSSLNQQEIEKLPALTLIFVAILYAPYVEELLFRGSIRRIIKNDNLFIIISGIVFGLLHTISEISVVEMILIGLPYIFCGMYFAYMYVKTENICIPMLCHLIHNSYAVFLVLLSRLT